MNFRRHSPETQFDAAVQLSMLEFARHLDPNFDSGVPHKLPEQNVREQDDWGVIHDYSFGGEIHSKSFATAVTFNEIGLGWVDFKNELWVQQTDQRYLDPDDFELIYGNRLHDPQSIDDFGRFAIFSCWRYVTWQGSPNLQRDILTSAWGYRPESPNAKKLRLLSGEMKPIWQRFLKRQPKPDTFDLMLEGQRIDTIFAKLGHSATQFSNVVSNYADSQSDFAALLDEFPNF